MLHEILLSLSGHPSPLLDQNQNGNSSALPELSTLLSRPEKELLTSLSHLSHLHDHIRKHAANISSTHPSTICRAVATAICSTQLHRFEQKIIQVEATILRRDADLVGGYDIVPLSAVVDQFEGWNRMLEWLWQLARYMMPISQSNDAAKETDAEGACTGAGIIDRLRDEMKTGYPTLEAAATELASAAEKAWLKQVSSWLLYGQLPGFGREDFFVSPIQRDGADGSTNQVSDFVVCSKLVPNFVPAETVASILYVGKSICLIRSRGISIQTTKARQEGLESSDTSLIAIHLSHLSSLTFPLSPSTFSATVAAIRLSLSQNTLNQLLPPSKIYEMLSLLHAFFLLGRGEFAVSLVNQADLAIRNRHRRANVGFGRYDTRKKDGLDGLVVKEGEVTTVLARTWAELSHAKAHDDSFEDQQLDTARELITLSITQPPSSPAVADDAFVHPASKSLGSSFRDLLLATPTTLWMKIPQPFDLFLSKSDVEIYSVINAYLLGLRRAHIRLAELWKHSALRRDYPSPLGPPRSNMKWGQEALQDRRTRANARTLVMRKSWATISSAVFLLAELGNYFQVDVIDASWKHFRLWLFGDCVFANSASRPPTRPSTSHQNVPDTPLVAASSGGPVQIHDPEALSHAHQLYLKSLYHSLLISDVSFSLVLRKLIAAIDRIIALFVRLQSVQQALDLQFDDGVDDGIDYTKQEDDLRQELCEAREAIDTGIADLVGRLKQIDEERPEDVASATVNAAAAGKKSGGYVARRREGVDRLLMKLDFGGSLSAVEDSQHKTLDASHYLLSTT